MSNDVGKSLERVLYRELGDNPNFKLSRSIYRRYKRLEGVNQV